MSRTDDEIRADIAAHRTARASACPLCTRLAADVAPLLAERDAALAVVAKAAEDVRELAELYLYDGDTDRAVNDGYGALLCLADVLAAPKESTP